MTPETFSRAIVSIERNHGLRLDARSVWLRMDATPCGRGWVGTKPGCKRAKNIKSKVQPESQSVRSDRRTDGKHSDVPLKKIPASDREFYNREKDGEGIARHYHVEFSPAKGKNKDAKRTKTEITSDDFAAAVKHKFNGESNLARLGRDLRTESETKKIEEREEQKQVSVIQKLTGLSEGEAKSSIKAIEDYSTIKGYSISNYESIRAVQQGKFKIDGRDLTSPEISKIKSSIKAIDQYVKKMPAFDGVIHRGISFESEEEQSSFLSKISRGYSLGAMSSFSSSKTTAKGFAEASSFGILFVVKNKSGASIRNLSQMKAEDEVIVPKGVKYKIMGNPKKVGGVVVVHMEEI